MNPKTTVQGYLISIASFCVIIAGMREAKALVVTILLSFFVAIILTPGLRWLQARRVPTPLALLLIIALVGTLGGGVVGVVGQSANQLVKRLPYYQNRLQSETNRLEEWIGEQSWSEWLLESRLNGDGQNNSAAGSNGVDSAGRNSAATESAANDIAATDSAAEENAATDSAPTGSTPTDGAPTGSAPIDSAGRDSGDEGLSLAGTAPIQPGLESIHSPPSQNEGFSQLFSLEPSDAVNLMKRLLGELGGLFSSALLILLTVIFILLEAARFPEKLKAAMGRGAGERVTEIVYNIRRYMFIKTTTSLLTGVMIAGFLLAYDIRYAVLWGLLAFLFNYVPNIGSILAAGPAVALAFVERGLTPAIVVAIGYVVVNCIVSYAIEPRFMGKGLGLSTLVVFLSLIFWGWVLGPIGMLLSAPLTMILKIILSNYEETRWIAVMLSAKAPRTEPDAAASA